MILCTNKTSTVKKSIKSVLLKKKKNAICKKLKKRKTSKQIPYATYKHIS